MTTSSSSPVLLGAPFFSSVMASSSSKTAGTTTRLLLFVLLCVVSSPLYYDSDGDVLRRGSGFAEGFVFNASLPLNASDLRALVAFKAGMSDHGGMLNDWNASDAAVAATHPCTWTGVKCACADIYPGLPAVHACPAADPDPNAAAATPTHNRVVFLDFGPGGRPANKFLAGTLAAVGLRKLNSVDP